MKLLIVTQVVDRDDPVLGFFHRWIEEFAKHLERVEVICLKEGKHNLPANVRVHSLGKEHPPRFARRLVYAIRFKLLVWRLRRDYDAVFVHMNQEYVLIAGWLWKLLGRRVYLWRNHYAGSWPTDVAAALCTKVFCTSRYSYTAKYKKTALMPVVADTERFTPDAHVARKPHSILFLARMAPSKRPEMLIDALAELARSGVDFNATLVGSPLPRDEKYYEGLKEKVCELGLEDNAIFLPGVPNEETPDLYRAHEIFVNASPSGMLDKTLFEAAACGCLPLAASADWAEQAGADLSFTDAASLARRLAVTLAYSPADIEARAAKLRSQVVERNSLTRLWEALGKAMR
ncbi:MAG: glycosyltransferase family 4 protein [Patescibacteria group bacterium]|nr:glycosyltransferase family 4 protein [Patescibacteria group bacterium]